MKKCSSIMMRKSKFIKNICNSNYCCCIYFHLVNEKDLAPSFSIENEKKKHKCYWERHGDSKNMQIIRSQARTKMILYYL